MKVSFQFKDEGTSPGILHCEAIVEFDLKMKDAFEAFQKLQEANISGVIAKALSEKGSAGDNKQ